MAQSAQTPSARGTATWAQVRVATFASRDPDKACLLDAVVNADDVTQGGKIGTCWLASVIASIADRDGGAWIRDFFHLHIGEGISPQGIYGVRVWGDGVARYVFVDDVLPCCDDGSGPAFTKSSSPHEWWVPLLEKVIVKMLGGYIHIEGGGTDEDVRQVVRMLTGAMVTENVRYGPTYCSSLSVCLSRAVRLELFALD